MKHIYLLITVLSVLLLHGCASKRYVKKAAELDTAGLYTDAADMYYRSLKANNKNIDAKLGLQRTGQMVLEDKIKEFKNQYTSGTAKDAVYAFRDAEAYFNKLKTVGIPVHISEEQKAYYREVEDLYLNKVYQDAMKALNLEEFSSAEQLFSEILTIHASYKDSKTHWTTAKYEPIYRQANEYQANNLFRKAYSDYETILKGTGGYKNSLELKAEALEKAMITIALVPVSYSNATQKQVSMQLKPIIVSHINNLKSPFYKVISDQVVSSMSNVTINNDPAAAVQWLKKMGADVQAKTILTGKIVRYTKQTGRISKSEKKAYRKRVIKVTDKETNLPVEKTVYDKIRYFEYQQNNTVQYVMEYALVNIENGEIIISDVFSHEERPTIHYATFDGDYKQLVPGYWKYMDKDSESDKVYDDSSSRDKLHQLFNNSKKIKSTGSIEKEMMNKCATQIAQQIEAYNPEN
ncbi:MAG: hypothetical protein JEZ14_01165 [Marinilabiliaceae bacterium]|nr:hypothetical protein [Marinilabiliaceae bacterium]